MEKIVITIEYENRKTFELKAKHGDSDALSIVKVQENSDLATLWPSVANICVLYCSSIINKAGEEMVKP